MNLYLINAYVLTEPFKKSAIVNRQENENKILLVSLDETESNAGKGIWYIAKRKLFLEPTPISDLKCAYSI